MFLDKRRFLAASIVFAVVWLAFLGTVHNHSDCAKGCSVCVLREAPSVLPLLSDITALADSPEWLLTSDSEFLLPALARDFGITRAPPAAA